MFRMDGRPFLVLAATAGAFVLGAILVVLAALVPSLISWLAAGLVILALAAIGGTEIVLWFKSGIRSIEIDADTLTLYRGAALRPERIPRASARAVRTVRRFGRRIAVVRRAAGRTLRIPEGAFPREEFSRFLAVLETWRRG